MATSTTTWNAIRDAAVLVVEALTPGQQSSVRYRNTRTERLDFREHALASSASALREFDLIPTGTDVLGIEDYAVQMRETRCEFVMAYPHHWGLYAVSGLQSASNRSQNRHAMLGIMEQDANAVMKAIGRRGSASYVSGQHAALEEEWSVEDADGLSFVVIPMRCLYYFDAS